MHYCCNIVTGLEGRGSAVLVRAAQPIEGLDVMRVLRHGVKDAQLTNGPGKVCQALRIDRRFNGHDLRQVPLVLVLKEPIVADQIVQTTRVGISRAKGEPWRFYIKDSPFVSKK
jgi:DNA-3-methyladenine glycosylase